MAASLVECAGRSRGALGPTASICFAELDHLLQDIILLTLHSKIIFFGGGGIGDIRAEIGAGTGAAATTMTDRMEPDFCLRPAEQGDYDFALALYLEGAKEHLTKIGRWDEDRFVALFHQGYKQEQTRIICVEGRVVGFIQVVDFTDRLYLRQLHLIDGFRGRGIGSTLIGAELKRGIETGRPVTLDVMHGNPARRLYVRLGFEGTGEDPDKEQMIRRLPHESEPKTPLKPSAPDGRN
jgi:ribosomal protein S18 acetylase RimI-like enzyme